MGQIWRGFRFCFLRDDEDAAQIRPSVLLIRKKWVLMTIGRGQILAQGTRVADNATFGPLLRKHRKLLGYTQEEVADMLGFSPRLVGEIERGRGIVGIDKVLYYATPLGIDLVAFER